MSDDGDFELALRVLKNGLEELKGVEGVGSFGKISTFSEAELTQLQLLQSSMTKYANDESPTRPFSVGVFGPPGSGKSFAVKQVVQAAQAESVGKILLPFHELNLTQMGAPQQLFDALRAVSQGAVALEGAGARVVPVVFFDEFDAPLGGAPLGWLSWFLAPMNDGVIAHGGNRVELSSAVYVFAGGTARKLDEFGRDAPARFREAKGPDFKSRLNAFCEVNGPNDRPHRALRRAVLAMRALEGGGIADDAASLLLKSGRYRHGARSVKAVVEAARQRSDERGGGLVKVEDLDQGATEIHFDRGVLDPDSLGGPVGLSLGATKDPKSIKEACSVMARALWSEGASIGYGGKWQGELTQCLLEAHEATMPPAINTPLSRLALFVRDVDQIDAEIPAGVDVIPVAKYWLPKAAKTLQRYVQMFRMRWLMTSRCVARVVAGGKLESFSGRMPGIVEEAMLALALRQPLYIVGGLGGASHLLGGLLGLADSGPGSDLGPRVATDKALTGHHYHFRPPGHATLPVNLSEAVSFIAAHAHEGPLWPDNGLSRRENEELFQTADAHRASALIREGLRRRFETFA